MGAAIPTCCGEANALAEERLKFDGEIIQAEGDLVFTVFDKDKCGGGGGGPECGAHPDIEDKLPIKSPRHSKHSSVSHSTVDTWHPCDAEILSTVSDHSVVAKWPTEVCSVTFDRRVEAKGLGLEFDQGARGRVLVVRRITAGFAKDHNSSKKGSPIRVGDYVYEINGVRDKAVAMIDQVRTSAKLEIVYGRPMK